MITVCPSGTDLKIRLKQRIDINLFNIIAVRRYLNHSSFIINHSSKKQPHKAVAFSLVLSALSHSFSVFVENGFNHIVVFFSELCVGYIIEDRTIHKGSIAHTFKDVAEVGVKALAVVENKGELTSCGVGEVH